MWTTGETWTVEFIKTQFLEYSCFWRYALHKCCTSYPILKKSKISSITKDFILYLLAPRIRMCYDSHSSYRRVLPWSLGTMQKHEELTSTGYTDKWCCTHIHDPAIFFYFLAFSDVFSWIWWRHQSVLMAMAQKLAVLKIFTPPCYLTKKWGQLGIRCALRVVLYLWTVFICVFYSQPFLSQFVLVTSKFLGSYKFQ